MSWNNNPIVRLASRTKLDSSTGCYNWVGTKMKQGYGVTVFNKKKIATHRLAYTCFIGDIPKGMFVCHKCDNRACHNPSHLFIGSHQDNMNDMKKKGRQVKRAGVLNKNAKLDESIIMQIRSLYPKKTQVEIAKMFDLSVVHVQSIIKRRRWAHVKEKL